MGRPKGSKNKPKDQPKPVEPPAKVARTVLNPFEGEEPQKEEKKPEDTGPKYMPIDMNNFVFTEHILERYAHYLMAQMASGDSLKLAKQAQSNGEKSTHPLIRRILKFIGLSDEKVNAAMEEVKAFTPKKQEQLYIRIKRR